jgi:hypothetical protein
MILHLQINPNQRHKSNIKKFEKKEFGKFLKDKFTVCSEKFPRKKK